MCDFVGWSKFPSRPSASSFVLIRFLFGSGIKHQPNMMVVEDFESLRLRPLKLRLEWITSLCFVSFSAFDGWKEWTLWSVCSHDNTQQRSRRCAHSFPAIDQCQGSALETRMCRYNTPESLPDPALQRTRSMSHGNFQIYHLIITGKTYTFLMCERRHHNTSLVSSFT